MKKILFLVLVVLSIAGLYNYFSIQSNPRDRYVADAVYWHGVRYNMMPKSPPFDVNEKFLMGRIDSEYSVFKLGRGQAINYLFVSTFLDDSIFVRDGYQAPVDGEITAVYENLNRIYATQDAAYLVQELLATNNMADANCVFNSLNDMTKLSTSYDASLVANKTVGYVGYLDGKWVYMPHVSHKQYSTLYDRLKTNIDCIPINQLEDVIKNIPEISYLSS